MNRHTRYQALIVADYQVLLIRHKEHACGKAYWVIPGGGIEDGESEGLTGIFIVLTVA